MIKKTFFQCKKKMVGKGLIKVSIQEHLDMLSDMVDYEDDK